MKRVLPLFIFVDACGWEIIKNDPFVRETAPNRRKLTSVFGYSSACVPSILSGRWPQEHRNWSYFVYDPVNSPFKSLRWMRFLPTAMTSRRIFRRWLSKFVKAHLNFRGYFDLYNIPFHQIAWYDFSEKKSPLQPKGMNKGPNIFDALEEREIPYHVSAPQLSEEQNMANLVRDIQSESIDFAFLYWPGLDGLLHMVGNQSPEVPAKLRTYDQWIASVMAQAAKHYEEVRLYVFSDHGMANCDELLDLRSQVNQLGLKPGKDYAVVYDSTMARFWFFAPGAKEKITACLRKCSKGRIVEDAELKSLQTYFEDRYFGELIFLVQEGVLIIPSHMGERPIRGMHGYHPADKHSFAVLCTNQEEIPENVTAIPHVYNLMLRDAQEAHDQNAAKANRRAASSPVPA
jgi:predicted AlkP superfamily pyrophosphatase or phosphodiesterase